MGRPGRALEHATRAPRGPYRRADGGQHNACAVNERITKRFHLSRGFYARLTRKGRPFSHSTSHTTIPTVLRIASYTRRFSRFDFGMDSYRKLGRIRGSF